MLTLSVFELYSVGSLEPVSALGKMHYPLTVWCSLIEKMTVMVWPPLNQISATYWLGNHAPSLPDCLGPWNQALGCKPQKSDCSFLYFGSNCDVSFSMPANMPQSLYSPGVSNPWTDLNNACRNYTPIRNMGYSGWLTFASSIVVVCPLPQTFGRSLSESAKPGFPKYWGDFAAIQ